MPTRYITGATNPTVAAVAFEYDLGLLLTPETAPVRKKTTWRGLAGTLGTYGATTGKGGAPLPMKERRAEWHSFLAFDNGAFGEKRAEDGGVYDPETDWLGEFRAWVREFAYRADDVLFFVCPDKLDWVPGTDANGRARMFPVGDAWATLEWAERWIPVMREIAAEEGWPGRLPLAFVAGDGMEELIELIPWDDIDWIFLGGSTDWKVGYGAERVAKEAKVRGKGLHMGRVSSLTRMRIADGFGCDSADGTFLRFGTDINLPRVMEWLDALNDRDPLPSYAVAKAKSERLLAETNARRKAKKVRSLAARKAAKTRAANKARAATIPQAA